MAKKILSNHDYRNSSRIVNHPAPASPGDLVRLQDLNDAIAQLDGVAIKIAREIDCSGNPNFPACDPGQTFVVTTGGKIGGASGIDVDNGDTIFCKNPNGSAGGDLATVGGDFFIVEGNRNDATEALKGLIRLASQTEVNNGTGAGAVTPVTLNSKLNTAFNNRRYSATIGDGTNSSFVVSHGLGNINVIPVLRETNSPFEIVEADIAYIDANNIQVSFINPPLNGEFTLIIKS